MNANGKIIGDYKIAAALDLPMYDQIQSPKSMRKFLAREATNTVLPDNQGLWTARRQGRQSWAGLCKVGLWRGKLSVSTFGCVYRILPKF